MQDDDADHSFDPKTWLKPGSRPADAAAPDTTAGDAKPTADPGTPAASFNPKTWLKPALPAESGPDPRTAASGPRPPAPPPAPPGRPFERSALIAYAIAAALLIAGAATAHFSYRKPVMKALPAAAAKPMAADLSRVMTLASLSELPEAFAASGISPAEAQSAAQTALTVLGQGKPGNIRLALTLAPGQPPVLERADIAFADSSGVAVTRSGAGFAATATAAALQTVMIVKRGEMDTNSFYSSAVTAGITDSLIPEFANAFSYDFDFQREINPGDIFEAAFEQTENAAGEAVGPPKLVYASLSTAQKSKAIYFFKPSTGDAGWYDGNGRSIIKSFLRTPIDGAHITSQFGMRVHPVLGFMKMHKGTDFGAPVGTPIYAAGDGTVAWAAMKGPNGNLTVIQHDNGWQTFYLHQSAFAPGVAAGVRVHQGETIGYVGTTGRSTGPHLHYEMHIDGQPVDAMTVPLEDGHSLVPADLPNFFKERNRIDAVRAQQDE